MARWAALLLLALLAISSPAAHAQEAPKAAAPRPANANVHTVFLTDCTPYSDWMSLGMVFSWKHSGQPGTLSKVMCCTDAEAAAYRKEMLTIVKTHIAPSFAKHPRTGDEYAGLCVVLCVGGARGESAARRARGGGER